MRNLLPDSTTDVAEAPTDVGHRVHRRVRILFPDSTKDVAEAPTDVGLTDA